MDAPRIVTNSWESLLEATSGDVRRLSYADRFTTIPVTLRENVAEHSYWVSLYAVMIHQSLGGDPSLLGAISVHALTHDLAECITGDVVRTFKYSTEELKQAIDSAEEIMLRALPEAVQDLYPLWEGLAGDRKAYVKAVIKAADFVSLFQYMNREVLRGNREIDQFIQRLRNDLRMMAKKSRKDPNADVQEFAGLYDLMSIRVGECGKFTT